MAENKITEGMGKKIVEALKMQDNISSDEDLFNISEDTEENIEEDNFDYTSDNESQEESHLHTEFAKDKLNITETPANVLPSPSALDDPSIPVNIAILKNLVTKLPAGVTKQTGALIIKQTMEALGISMKTVLQEAQQVQDNLNSSIAECISNIEENKKQIQLLENEVKKYKQQNSALNDIISLFVQIN